MNSDKWHKWTGWAVFLLSLAVYLRTIAPTVSFWDCGEFIACATAMGIPHPPGSPLFIMLAKIFSYIPLLDHGLRVNLISAFSSAGTVLVLYLIIVRLIMQWQTGIGTKTDALLVYGSSALGALSFAFTDSFWFNAVEAEVYALSMFCTALVVWLGLLWMDNHKRPDSFRYLLFMLYILALGPGIHLLNLLAIPSVLLFIIFADHRVLYRGGLWGAIPLFLIIGFSIYLIVYIRAELNPPINMNNPSTLEGLKEYLNREQYGSSSMFLDIFNRKAPMWSYQIEKMFLRYFGWQFIGKGTELGGDGLIAGNYSLRGLYAFPLIAGMLGLVFHWLKDWKRALSITVLFLITGIILNIYLNQPQSQPRESDYVYVGCFFAFSIWIGIGILAFGRIISVACDNYDEKIKHYAAGAALLAAGLLVPLRLFSFNFDEHDRAGNYVPWDYSYNILETCEPDAILFTNGDNDTYPLWYLQIVEGIRRDVRIVNLSLLNTDWYIRQLRDGEPKLRIDLTDNDLSQMAPILWPAKQIVKFEFQPGALAAYLREQPDVARKAAETNFMVFEVSPTLSGKAIRPQDLMIFHIIQNNAWRKPIYFAITVPSSNYIGLDSFFRLDGMAYKLIPFKNPPLFPARMEEKLFSVFRYRNLDNPGVFYDRQTVGLLQNYRTIAYSLIKEYELNQEWNKIHAVLDSVYVRFPDDVVPATSGYFPREFARFYFQLGETEKSRRTIANGLMNPLLSINDYFELAKLLYEYYYDVDAVIAALDELSTAYPGFEPVYRYAIPILEEANHTDKAILYVNKWLGVNPSSLEALRTRERIARKADSLRATQ